MFLKSYTELAVGFSAICHELLWCPAATIVEVASDVQRRGQQLLDEVELGQLTGMFNEHPRIEVGERPFNDRIASLPFRLWAEDHGQVPWSLYGSLDAAWLGPGRTHLSLSAQYELRLMILGGGVDRALVHRVAETTAQRFLEMAARRLMG